MSLTTNDLDEIRNIVESAIHKLTVEEIRPIQNEIKGLRSDIKEIYDRLDELEGKIMPDKNFNKLSLEQKILKLNSELIVAAKQAGVSLPR